MHRLTSTPQCPVGKRCDGGSCVSCDVCHGAGLCAYSTVQAAVAAGGPSTIHICPGAYTGNTIITRNVSLIGAGQGNGPGATILNGGGVGRTLHVFDFNTVALQNLRITGGLGSNGGGILNHAAVLTLTDCTITGNTATTRGGGIFRQSSVTTLTLENTDVTGNTAENTDTSGGGIFNGPAGTVVLTDGSSVSGNDPNNCRGPGTYDDLDGACVA